MPGWIDARWSGRSRGPSSGLAPLVCPLALLLLASLPGCASDGGEPFDLLRSVPRTRVQVRGAAIDPIWVQLKADKRPLKEQGEHKYVGTSTLGDSSLMEPTSVVLLHVLARDLVLAGAASQASVRDKAQPYLLEVTIEHCNAAYGEGLENLLFIFPTSSIEAHCSALLALKDRDGRLFLQQHFEGKVSSSASLLGGLQEAAAQALAEAMRAAVDAALQPLRDAPEKFWARFQRAPPGASDDNRDQS